MPTYRYTHEYDAIFPDLQHGVNADVKGAGPDLAGSTVVLSLGDEVTVKEPFAHAHLEEVGRIKPEIVKPTEVTE